MSQCGCGCGGDNSGGGGVLSSLFGGGGGGGGVAGIDSGDYQDTLLSSRKLCFKCATFWIIIVILAFFVLARSGK